MNATCLRFTALLALLFATSCMWANVEPAPDLDLVHARSARPALGFDLRFTEDPRLISPGADAEWAEEFDGEDLAEQTAIFRAALEGTGTFGSITRTQAVDGLHCAFELHWDSGVFGGGVWFALTLGLIPDLTLDEYLLTATVSAPGRQSSSYRVRTSGRTFLWLPMLPVGLVQAAVRRGELQQTVDALVTQMAKDGWLER
jgi:hypothetical protein